MRRSPRLDTAALRECDRNSGRIDCVFVAHGQTKNAEVDCRLKVEVRRGHGHPSARILARTCQVALRPLLTSARAREAIASVAETRIGSDSAIELDRVSRSVFLGFVAWPPPDESDGRTPCVFKFVAELVPPDTVLVDGRGVTCAA